jgi:penicillin-binding protein 1A
MFTGMKPSRLNPLSTNFFAMKLPIHFSPGPYRTFILRSWLVFLGLLLTFFFYLFAVSVNLFWLFGKMPDFKLLENPKSDLASEIYSADNKLLGKYFIANRTPVEFDSVSPHIVHALIATEDIRFDKHSGIDFKATLSIPWYLITLNPRGSSTLSQQLAKNLFEMRKNKEYQGALYAIPGLRTFIIKTKEWIVAIKLERNYTKKEILTMYLNTVDFGSGAFGIQSACKTFFRKNAASVSLPEAALLVGMLQNPSFLNPVYHEERAIRRRNVVLAQMFKYDFISKTTFEETSQQALSLHYQPENYAQGSATYFRSVLKRELEKWANEKGYNLYTDGLKIYTTVDARMQEYAEEVVMEHMKSLQSIFNEQWKDKNPWIDDDGREIKGYLEKEARKCPRFKQLQEKYPQHEDSVWLEMKKPVPMNVFTWKGSVDTMMSSLDSIRHHKRFLQCGFMAMDPLSGDVKAWVGGIDFKHFQYDHVKQGRRQPGSSFKPIVYTTAIDYKGYTPCSEVTDDPVTFPKDEHGKAWTPQNATRVYTGQKLTLRQAIGQSVNTVSAYLVKDLGATRVVKYAAKLGINTEGMEAVPSICLGTQQVSLYELLGAYSTFVNSGTWTEPRYLVRIEDRNGNVLQEFRPKSAEVLSEQTAYLMVHLLQGGLQERGGTARGLYSYKCAANNEIGGKTGTTQNYSDGWFVGITHNMVAGARVGGDQRYIRFRNYMGEGARVALPIWGRFMDKVYADPSLGVQKGTFKRPQKLEVTLDCQLIKEAASKVDTTQFQHPTPDSLDIMK